MSKTTPLLLTVAGPTAVGKTALCVQLAQYFGTDVVSADARQFFREMSIGTAKPTAEEMQGVPHHFVDSHSVTEDYSAGRYETDCLALLRDLFQRHSVVILTGGSGLYLQAVTDGFDELPPADATVRAALQQQLDAGGLPALLAQLAVLDPVCYARIDRQNPVRVLRALEVCLSSGQPFSSFHSAGPKAERPFQVRKIALSRERNELYQRIDQRVDQMLAHGLLGEVRGLLPYRHAQALQTVGYQEIFGYLDGDYDYAEAVRLLKRNTRRYAKRQLTWLRRDPAYQWLHPDEAFERIIDSVQGPEAAT
ncbi:tRNA (adenosine(37)-N6)-dimethylallyltransferase MiaA [Hymenobacter busanensis]|uniref:tRNA dimethylallyltransferase n=1 Tax=Hymenobacter busanensis TaxID=2607656 RepID=A0A7L4ZS24_9BACT|nr:tRNA (adenosine(37)-N6)-dimethylallyltransferase MiaA [Hymenobacter busanensis]KAA9327607.1 tRNA (adenosine(37)-N6)-dimethylallyltransferase MiaA [Hymenobacter busanensis]QHJ06054.1 tRNA (adenosine(37)-N6)-dimethylallyltransferase MiaA [Hymenobacter busanensis]